MKRETLNKVILFQVIKKTVASIYLTKGRGTEQYRPHFRLVSDSALSTLGFPVYCNVSLPFNSLYVNILHICLEVMCDIKLKNYKD